MRRREFIKLVSGTAAVSSLAARAQQAALPVVGILSIGSAAERAPFIAAFREGLG
jgi:putative ABC transport system substrate-binding protein